MGLYRAVMVEGLSIAHGREERRQFCPFFPVFISITLKDNKETTCSEKLIVHYKLFKLIAKLIVAYRGN